MIISDAENILDFQKNVKQTVTKALFFFTYDIQYLLTDESCSSVKSPPLSSFCSLGLSLEPLPLLLRTSSSTFAPDCGGASELDDNNFSNSSAHINRNCG